MVPDEANRLAHTLKHTHGRYASYWNAKHRSSGHVWQGRFYSCPLGGSYLWEALRYTELNPVRAGMVADAASWLWSSAGAHCGVAPAKVLTMDVRASRWTPCSWKEYLAAGQTEEERKAIRQGTHTGRPLGDEEFVRSLENSTQRSLSPRKGRRPAKQNGEFEQAELFF